MNGDMEIEWLKSFGLRLREARVRNQMTQAALGAKLGVSAQLISTWERGTEAVPFRRAVELATLLQVDIRSVSPPPSADRERAFSYAVADMGLDRAMIALLRQALPESIEKALEKERWGLGLTVQRMLSVLVLSYQMQSAHVQEMCVPLATAIDEGRFTFDEAICFFRVHQPAIMEPKLPEYPDDPVKDMLSERLALILIDAWEGQAKMARLGKGKSEIEAIDATERQYAKERREDAEARRKACDTAGKDVAPGELPVAASKKKS